MAMLLASGNSAECCCPPMSGPIQTYPLKPPSKVSNDKYFHEVGAEMTGNQLIIRMEKDKSKSKKSRWEPPCDCDVIEIKRPTGTRGPKIVNGGDNNQILFRIHSKTHLNKKDDPYYRPQAIAYKINRSGTSEDNHCRKITVFPQLGGPVSQEVYSDHISEGNHDVYLLRVKKNNDTAENNHKRNLEVELRTPKPPPKVSTPVKQQPVICSPKPVCEEIEAKKEKCDKKKKQKNEKKGKSKKKK